ncbi:MAG: Holliday junction resolvase RuvX [Anaerolineae bacterium]|nr:Holliday junction resolvase RuvX [Anaerolineae bacterium]
MTQIPTRASRGRLPLGRLLALDVGSRRIGVAVCDELGFIATPLEVIHHTSKKEDMGRIADKVRQERAKGVVVGHPLNDDGSAGPQARYIEQYTAGLEASLREAGLDVPVILWDEHGSTQRAQQAMMMSGRGARQRRKRLDAAAAAAILQDYLDAHRPPPPAGGEPGTPEGYSDAPDQW